jgi:hypothetical protein
MSGNALIYDMSEEDIEDKIQKNLAIKEEEKNQFGEVFTPISLINEMLDELEHFNKDIFSNPNLTWLDPANGIGNFPIVIYKRLMKGLETRFKDKKKRHDHIIKNMLYMIEINPKNVKISKKIFGTDANICCGDFLSDKCFEGMNFDVIIGNPPYNENGTGKGGGVFWKEFVFKSFDILNKNGYLTFIHPTGWRKPIGERASAGDVWNIFKKNNLIFLKMSDKKIPNFPRVDYYVLQKSTKQTNTKIINKFENHIFDGKIHLYELPFIPHFVNEEVLSILHKVISKSGDKFNILYNQSFKPNKEDIKKSGIPHTFYYDPSIKDYLLVYKNYKGTIPEYINENKIIMTHTNGKKKGYLYPKYYSNEMGSTRNTMYQLINREDNIESILILLNSNLINFILKITQYSESPNHKNEFKILNMISKPNDKILKTEKDVYKYYELNQKEINLIEVFMKDIKQLIRPAYHL